MKKYPEVLKYYMWGYQVYFFVACQSKAETIFNKLDRGLMPRIIIAGFDDKNKRVNIEPENREALIPLFNNIEIVAKEELENHPDRDIHYSGPGMQDEMQQRLEQECFRLAVEKVLNESQEGKLRTFFVSKEVQLDDNKVYIILSIDRNVYDSHTHLKERFFNERYRIFRSLLETSVDVFLSDCANNLYQPNPGKSLSFDGRRADELLRESARQLTYTFSSKGAAFEGLHGLFDACNNLSIHRYEGKENLGTILIASKNHKSIEYTLELQEPFNLSDFRKTRKLMQLSNDEISVICNSKDVLGLGKIKDNYNPASESIFKILFKGIHCWEVWHNNNPILIMRYGQPQFLTEIIKHDKFNNDCKRIFSGITEAECKNLFELSVAATRQKNGALVVFTDAAEEESIRLNKQSIPIKPLKLNDEEILNLTSIDGAVLVDRTGTAFAHGVILDGVVSKKGDSSRGSRFNSAVTYIENTGRSIPTMAVVVSEDGMVDVIPQLRPQISKAELKGVIGILKDQVQNFDTSTFNSAMEFLSAREFYLSKEQCELINQIRREIDDGPFDGIRIVYRDLQPNEEMNGSYFVD